MDKSNSKLSEVIDLCDDSDDSEENSRDQKKQPTYLKSNVKRKVRKNSGNATSSSEKRQTRSSSLHISQKNGEQSCYLDKRSIWDTDFQTTSLKINSRHSQTNFALNANKVVNIITKSSPPSVKENTSNLRNGINTYVNKNKTLFKVPEQNTALQNTKFLNRSSKIFKVVDSSLLTKNNLLCKNLNLSLLKRDGNGFQRLKVTNIKILKPYEKIVNVSAKNIPGSIAYLIPQKPANIAVKTAAAVPVAQAKTVPLPSTSVPTIEIVDVDEILNNCETEVAKNIIKAESVLSENKPVKNNADPKLSAPTSHKATEEVPLPVQKSCETATVSPKKKSENAPTHQKKPKVHRAAQKKRSMRLPIRTSCSVPKKCETFEPGDLVWTRIGNYPYWPSIVFADDTGNFKESSVEEKTSKYHVKFFGDNGRSAWVSGSRILMLKTFSDIDMFRKNATGRIKKTFTIRFDQKEKWAIAVKEARPFLQLPQDDRIVRYKKYLEYLKRQASLTVDKAPVKKIEEIIPEPNKPSSPANNSQMKKIEKKAKLLVENDGTISRHDKKPFVSDSKISKNTILKLKNKIKFSKPKLKRKLRRRLYKQNLTDVPPTPLVKPVKETEKPAATPKEEAVPIPVKQEIKKETSESEESTSDLESKPVVPFKSIKSNLNSLFKKASKELFCQVCEKPGGVFKCQGPCRGVFHKDCTFPSAMPALTKIEPLNSCDPEEMPILQEETTVLEASTASIKRPRSPTADSEVSESKKMKPAKKNGEQVTFLCANCSTETSPPCFVCNEVISKTGEESRKKCCIANCGKFFHRDCLKLWPQVVWQNTSTKNKSITENLHCPLHMCHTCTSDDPRGALSRSSNEKLTKCIRCPTSYHSTDFCIPAGTEILSNSQIICPKHATRNEKTKPNKHLGHVNANWCFICAIGGSLICCETCPTSFHVECLKITPPEGSYICEDCESGRLPLYHEVVWAKLGSYRWWPGQILHPHDIPERLKSMHHNFGDFVVKFFGSHDHYWLNRGRVFLFQEGDTGKGSGHTKHVDQVFQRAVEEASVAHKILQEQRENRVSTVWNNLKPPPYIKIKTNRPVGTVRIFDGDTSNAVSCDCDPSSENPCGPDSDCINRLLLTECSPELCPAKENCKNRMFEKRIYPPLACYKTNGRGWGLKCLTQLKKGDFVIEYVGEMINEEEYQKRLKQKHDMKEENYYFLTIDKDRMIDAGPKGNLARFMNHSCQPNCETQKWTVNGDTRIGLFALDDIPANTELTFNYNLESIGTEKRVCKCGAPNCSGFIGVKAKKEKKKEKSHPKKVKKVNSKKKAKVEVKLEMNGEISAVCFACNLTGGYNMCSNKQCSKFYHLECVGLSQVPEAGKWTCKWHTCNDCGKRTMRCCVKCPNSFCPLHSEKQITYNSKLSAYICTDHEQEKTLQEIPKAVCDLNSSNKNMEDLRLKSKFKRSKLSLKKDEENEATEAHDNKCDDKQKKMKNSEAEDAKQSSQSMPESKLLQKRTISKADKDVILSIENARTNLFFSDLPGLTRTLPNEVKPEEQLLNFELEKFTSFENLNVNTLNGCSGRLTRRMSIPDLRKQTFGENDIGWDIQMEKPVVPNKATSREPVSFKSKHSNLSLSGDKNCESVLDLINDNNREEIKMGTPENVSTENNLDGDKNEVHVDLHDDDLGKKKSPINVLINDEIIKDSSISSEKATDLKLSLHRATRSSNAFLSDSVISKENEVENVSPKRKQLTKSTKTEVKSAVNKITRYFARAKKEISEDNLGSNANSAGIVNKRIDVKLNNGPVLDKDLNLHRDMELSGLKPQDLSEISTSTDANINTAQKVEQTVKNTFLTNGDKSNIKCYSRKSIMKLGEVDCNQSKSKRQRSKTCDDKELKDISRTTRSKSASPLKNFQSNSRRNKKFEKNENINNGDFKTKPTSPILKNKSRVFGFNENVNIAESILSNGNNLASLDNDSDSTSKKSNEMNIDVLITKRTARLSAKRFSELKNQLK